MHDLAIVGAGPIGIELAVVAGRAGLSAVLFEAGALGQTIARWPRNTEFFSTPERIAIAGVPIQDERQGRITGERYLAYLRAVVREHDVRLRPYEPVGRIRGTKGAFAVETTRHGSREQIEVAHVAVAIGGLAAPRRLDIPGDDLPHARHYWRDPDDYFGTRVLVVGGRNSAAETALRCWRAGADVVISHRRPALHDRIKPHLGADLHAQLEAGTIAFRPSTVPVETRPGLTLLAPTDADGLPVGPGVAEPADFVLLCTGFVADLRLLGDAGVPLEGDAQIPRLQPQTMETPIPGLYVAGTAAGGTQDRFGLFIENSHIHAARIVAHLRGQDPPPSREVPAALLEGG
jgi:thioredoxin reductase (NADPH)